MTPTTARCLAPYLVDDVARSARPAQGREPRRSLLDGVADLRPRRLRLRHGGAASDRHEPATWTSVDDLKGKKIRTVPLAPELAFWEALGAAPTPMPLPSLYDAFANGQVDGMQIDFEGTWNTGYYEHADTVIESGHMMFPMIAVGSGRKWQTIGEEERATIESVLEEELDTLVSSYERIDAEALEELRGTGVKVVSVDRAFFGPAIDAWYDEWRGRTPMLEKLEAEASE